MKETFEQLLENNKAKIYRICKIYAVSPLEPQDLFQEVIFAIWKSLPTFKGNSSIDTWIYRITLNICLRSKQKSEKTQDIPIFVLFDDIFFIKLIMYRES